MSQEKKPVVALTIGDPAGIGPEISVATMMEKRRLRRVQTFFDWLSADYRQSNENHGL